MKVISQSVIYENPLPQLRSRHSVFPNLCETADGTLLACHSISEAFESVDGTSYISRSHDGGRIFGKPEKMFTKSPEYAIFSDTCKITRLKDGRIAALGYAFDRTNPELPIGNPDTGGLLENIIFISFSEDNGKTWSQWQTIDCSWGRHVEVSAPLSVLKSGAWVTPITGFSAWDGTKTGQNCGRILRSDDDSRHWSDDTICMAFEDADITCYEQRLCQLDSGAVVVIGWNENTRTGERLKNHFTISYDDARTFSEPKSTGIAGQASSLCALGGEKLLALHAVRRDTQNPGIYGYLVDLSRGEWNIQDELLIWEPAMPVVKNTRMAEIFSFLKFGQPSAIKMSDGTIMMSHWCEEQGQCKTLATRIEL